MDGAVALARWLCHNLYAGIQNLITRHDEACRTAPEKLRKHAPEVCVDLVESQAELLACFGVNLVDGVFERAGSLLQVIELRIEKLLALARVTELVERGKVDRAERGDLAIQALRFAP
nr:hypothetical protein [Thiomonas sp. FB-Cd]